MFLINTFDPLAIRYNCNNVLESMHVSESIALMLQPPMFFLEGLGRSKFLDFTQLLVKLVLATDMSKHAEILGAFNAKYAAGGGFNMDLAPDRHLALQLIIKSADLSNAARPWEVAKMWAERVTSEFFNQGDKERAAGIPVSMFMDRATTNIPKMQISFGDAVVRPLMEAMMKLVPDTEEIITTLKENSLKWQTLFHDASSSSRSSSGSISTIPPPPQPQPQPQPTQSY